ncbi:molybdenum cofactor biosynthesis protein MoaE [Pirellulaceae bacterium]|jgi:molybdopterin synthase catalytic subunit|nr:molybdenum cofactor biosynthesis protein MoaE [Pirellulaceae bacterium]
MAVHIIHLQIDTQRMLATVSQTNAGAQLLFIGTTRDVTGDRVTQWLDYEAYEPMAVIKLEQLESTAIERWDICAIEIVHRLGKVLPGEASVAIAVSAPHREHAFECGRWLIDTLKQDVPIWKQEHWLDEQPQWIHPVDKALGES